MSKTTIECFFDCSSPWTYMGFERLIKLKQCYDFTVIWKPILVGGVFNEINQGLYEARESMFNNKRRLTSFMKDLQDWARYCELTINWPDFHPVNSLKAMRGCIVALEQDRLIDFARGCFQAYWGELEDISQDDQFNDYGAEIISSKIELYEFIFNEEEGFKEFEAHKKKYKRNF